MGWNSWDSYGLTVTEAEFKANVSWLHQHLQPLGWQYVVVDEGWYLRQPGQKGAAQGFVMDADGRYLVADNRFSSSGFKPLADWVHAWGSSSASTLFAAFRGRRWRRTCPSRVLISRGRRSQHRRYLPMEFGQLRVEGTMPLPRPITIPSSSFMRAGAWTTSRSTAYPNPTRQMRFT